MNAIPPDYDTDPERSRLGDPSWLLHGDAHESVAQRIVEEHLDPVLDVGCGRGRLADLLTDEIQWVGIDTSATQLRDCPHRPVVRGEAARLPFPAHSFAAVTALWMLYHLGDPVAAIREAWRVLRPGGLFVACTSARNNDPELTDGYPATTFDAEEAPAVVSLVFGEDAIEVQRWDGPWTRLPDRDAIIQYVRSHFLPPEAAARVCAPLTLTKRGCLVWAQRTRKAP